MRHQVSVRAKNPAISETTDHRVRLYAIAAAAASVSALALAQPAEGEIIVTNKTIPIHANTGLSLDLNGDGVTDFDFFLSNYTISHPIVNNLFVSQPGSFNAGNSVIGTGYLASALLRGAKIGPGGPFIKTYAKYGVGIEGSALCTQNCGGKSGYSFDQRLQGKVGRRPSQPVHRGEVQDQRQDPLRMDTFDGNGEAQRKWQGPDGIILRDDHRIRLRVGAQ